MIEINNELKELAKIFKENNSTLYIVGGYVRDSLLNIKNKDIDLCSKSTLSEVESFLSKTECKFSITNESFGTAKISINGKSYEYTTFRKDYYDESGSHCPKSVEFIRNIEEDAKRRDFTINAIYYDISSDKIIDFFNAQKDLSNCLLRAISPIEETLRYDGERILRMVKFETKLNFKIEKETWETAIKFENNLKTLSKIAIKKFLKSIDNYTLKQKEQMKQTLILLDANFIAKQIIKEKLWI